MSRGTSTPFRRILVAEAPVRRRDPATGITRARPLPCRIAVLPWVVDRSWLSVIVGATFRFDPASARRPVPLEPAPPRPFHAGASSAGAPRVDDFVPMRLLVDLAVTGHVDVPALPSGTVAPRRLRVGLGERDLDVLVKPPQPGRVALRPPHTQTTAGRPLDLRPQACHDGSRHGYVHEAEFDLSVYQASVPELRWELDAVTGIHLAGFGADPEAALTLALPALAPRALVDYAQAGVQQGDVRLFLDGIAVDVDASSVDVTWRGLVETTARPHLDVERIVVGWAPPARWEEDAKSAWDDCLRELPRGHFQWATERKDVVHGEDPPALSEEELAMARYETWGHANAADPELPPEQAAAIAAELAEQRWPRAEVLSRHGIDEYAWGIEERAWAQRAAAVRDDPAGGPSADYALALRRASDALATPREAEITPAQYVALAARLGGGDPAPALAAAGLGLGGYLRVERRFRAQAAADRGFAAELSRLRADEEARLHGPAASAEGDPR
jgi:hypothetical protein